MGLISKKNCYLWVVLGSQKNGVYHWQLDPGGSLFFKKTLSHLCVAQRIVGVLSSLQLAPCIASASC
jgi:hypothetical protein